jgi:cell shape-determining protein MreC
MKAIKTLKEFVRLVEEEGLDLHELCEQTDLIKEAIKEINEMENNFIELLRENTALKITIDRLKIIKG